MANSSGIQVRCKEITIKNNMVPLAHISTLSVAYMVAIGIGVAQSPSIAAKWWELAARQGMPLAQNDLANQLGEQGIEQLGSQFRIPLFNHFYRQR